MFLILHQSALPCLYDWRRGAHGRRTAFAYELGGVEETTRRDAYVEDCGEEDNHESSRSHVWERGLRRPQRLGVDGHVPSKLDRVGPRGRVGRAAEKVMTI